MDEPNEAPPQEPATPATEAKPAPSPKQRPYFSGRSGPGPDPHKILEAVEKIRAPHGQPKRSDNRGRQHYALLAKALRNCSGARLRIGSLPPKELSKEDRRRMEVATRTEGKKVLARKRMELRLEEELERKEAKRARKRAKGPRLPEGT